MSFKFTASVPRGIRSFLRPRLIDWIKRADCPVFGVDLGEFGEVDLVCRPWPPEGMTTVGAERDIDEINMTKWCRP